MKAKTNKDKIEDAKVEISSDSIYAELGYKNPEEMETKSTLVMEISKAIKKKKLTQAQAALMFGISQPKLSELLRGRFRGYSVERLMYFLNVLGRDVDIIIKSKPRNRRARVNVYPLPPKNEPSMHRMQASSKKITRN